MTTKETAAAIRTALKTTGYGRDVVGVAVTVGGSVRVTIKSNKVKRSIVKGIVGKFEKIDRCPVTHEILCGGNTFVFVQVDQDVLTERRAEIRAAAEAAGLSSKGYARFSFEGVVYEVQPKMAVICKPNGVGEYVGSPYNIDEAIEAVASHSLG